MSRPWDPYDDADPVTRALRKLWRVEGSLNLATEARIARGHAQARLRCLERGCRESVGYLEVFVRDGPPAHPSERDGAIRFRFEVRAPFEYETIHDDAVLFGQRYRMTGAIDGRRGAVVEFSDWPRGTRIEVTCRHGHLSRFGAGHIARRLRAVLV